MATINFVLRVRPRAMMMTEEPAAGSAVNAAEIPCVVGLTIAGSSGTQGEEETYYKSSIPATLVPRAGQKTLIIHMQDDFRVTEDDLRSHVSVGTGWATTVLVTYKIHVTFSFRSPDFAAHFQNYMQSNDGAPTVSTLSRLSATWDESVDFDGPDGMVPLFESRGQESARFALDVVMNRTRPEDEVTLGSLSLGGQTTLGPGRAPVSLARSKCAKGPDISVGYTFAGSDHELRKDGLWCAYCAIGSLSSLNHLRSHLKTAHDSFTFRLETTPARKGPKVQLSANFVCDAPHSLGSLEAHHVRKQPFVRRARPDADLVQAKLAARSNGLQLVLEEDIDTDTMVARALSAGPPPKKRFRVPKAPPGVKFFAAGGRRRLREGELASESDSEKDMDVVKARHLQRLSISVHRSPEVRLFLSYWDRHFFDEHHHGCTSLRDGLIRFLHTLCDDMLKDGLRKCILQKLDELLETREISARFHRYTTRFVKERDDKRREDEAAEAAAEAAKQRDGDDGGDSAEEGDDGGQIEEAGESVEEHGGQGQAEGLAEEGTAKEGHVEGEPAKEGSTKEAGKSAKEHGDQGQAKEAGQSSKERGNEEQGKEAGKLAKAGEHAKEAGKSVKERGKQAPAKDTGESSKARGDQEPAKEAGTTSKERADRKGKNGNPTKESGKSGEAGKSAKGGESQGKHQDAGKPAQEQAMSKQGKGAEKKTKKRNKQDDQGATSAREPSAGTQSTGQKHQASGPGAAKSTGFVPTPAAFGFCACGEDARLDMMNQIFCSNDVSASSMLRDKV